VQIQNASPYYTIEIFDKYISGNDASSFILNHKGPLVLAPGQTDSVTIRFFPHTSGLKQSVFNIMSDYALAPHLYVPLSGIAGSTPVIYTDMREIDFGIMYRGQVKDTTITIYNVGVTDLIINSRSFLGANPDMFTLRPAINSVNPIVILGGESANVTIRATATLPNEEKNAQLQLNNNDPSNAQYRINLLANVSSANLVLNVDNDRIIFDSVTIGYHQDTVLILTNAGDVVCNITRFELSGAYSTDFTILDDVTTPFSLEPGESKVVNIRFNPRAVGLRYAVINITSNDRTTPNRRVTLQGVGILPNAFPIISFGNGETEWDYGAVPIRETRTKQLLISNPSKYNTLRIDDMVIDNIVKQPFSYGDIEFPLFIPATDSLSITLSFTPIDKVRYYEAHMTIYYSDSVTTEQNPDDTLKVLLRGRVIFPDMDIILTPVLKFGTINQGTSLTKEFSIFNRSELYLMIDSIIAVGEDAAEFTVNNKDLPKRIELDEEYMGNVTFKAGNIGAKDARLLVYNTDLFGSNTDNDYVFEIEIMAGSKLPDSNVVGITKLDEIPTVYSLSQNYPNPFNPTTKIEYALPEPSRVIIAVYNSLGQEVINLVDEYQSIGKYLVEFNAKNLPSGIYFYRIQSDKFTAVKKMMLLK